MNSCYLFIYSGSPYDPGLMLSMFYALCHFTYTRTLSQGHYKNLSMSHARIEVQNWPTQGHTASSRQCPDWMQEAEPQGLNPCYLRVTLRLRSHVDENESITGRYQAETETETEPGSPVIPTSTRQANTHGNARQGISVSNCPSSLWTDDLRGQSIIGWLWRRPPALRADAWFLYRHLVFRLFLIKKGSHQQQQKSSPPLSLSQLFFPLITIELLAD
jgi:hypothetical protein